MRILAFIAALVGLLLLLMGTFPDALNRDWDQIDLVRLVAIVVLCSGAIVALLQQRVSVLIKQIGAWVLIGLVCVALYGYRGELEQIALRIQGELLPSSIITSTEGELVIRRSSNGHFYADAAVDGASVRMLIDTGASSVVLSAAAAERVGFNIEELSYLIPVSTANGEALVAPVTLRSLALGSVREEDIGAVVAAPGALDVSVLGMSFLSRFQRVELAGDRLVLRP